MQVSNFGRFFYVKAGVNLYADRLIREYIRCTSTLLKLHEWQTACEKHTPASPCIFAGRSVGDLP